MSITLSINIFNSGYRPVDGGRGWDPVETATWPASTATLIAGVRDAILVDALMTANDGARLAAWVRDSGKNLTAIVVTHGHGDHLFGAGNVLAAFPGAPLVALNAAVVTEARTHTDPPILDNWIGWFGDKFDHTPAVPTALESGELDIEGHPVKLIEIGGADGALATVVQIPELEVVCSGDALLFDLSTFWTSREEWL